MHSLQENQMYDQCQKLHLQKNIKGREPKSNWKKSRGCCIVDVGESSTNNDEKNDHYKANMRTSSVSE